MSEPLYTHFEVVRVAPRAESNATITRLAGCEGAVLGIAQGQNRTWHYAVSLYGRTATAMFAQDDLESTGRFDKSENFYDGTRITVMVDPETGEGSIRG